MSEKKHISWFWLFDAAAYCLAAAFVWGTLFMTVHPFHYIPAAQTGYPAKYQPNGPPQPDGFWAIKIGDVLTLVILTVQAGIFAAQAYLSHKQRDIMSGQLKAAEAASTAAAKAADAALAALDRPWLSIEGLKNTRGNWMSGQGDLTAEFHVSNHGKAPAILASVNAILFLGYENIAATPFGGEKIPQTVLKFPSSEPELRSFLTRLSKWPLVDVSDNLELVDAIIPKPASGPRTFIRPLWGPKRFDSPLALPSGAATETFRWRESDLVSERNGKIPEDAWADVFLLGQIVYFGPTIGPEVINFSYKASPFGGFQLHGGAPYNERKKNPDLPGLAF